MEIGLILKIAGVGILTAVVHQILKNSGKDDFATFATLAGIIVVLMMILDVVFQLFETIKTMFGL